MNKNTHKILVFLWFGLLSLVLSACNLGKSSQTSEPLPEKDDFTSVITSVEFPLESVNYSPDWPDDLKFPDEIMLVEYQSGDALKGSSQGWSGKYRFNGDPSKLSGVLTNHFEQSGWNSTLIGDFPSSGYVLLLEKDQGDGLVIVDVDPDDPSETIIMVSLFP